MHPIIQIQILGLTSANTTSNIIIIYKLNLKTLIACMYNIWNLLNMIQHFLKVFKIMHICNHKNKDKYICQKQIVKYQYFWFPIKLQIFVTHWLVIIQEGLKILQGHCEHYDVIYDHYQDPNCCNGYRNNKLQN